MDKQTQEFLEYANEATTKIMEINKIFGGTGWPEERTLLGDTFLNIGEMIAIYIAPIIGKERNSDELNDIVTNIMDAEKGEIDSIVKKYCSISE